MRGEGGEDAKEVLHQKCGQMIEKGKSKVTSPPSFCFFLALSVNIKRLCFSLREFPDGRGLLGKVLIHVTAFEQSVIWESM